MEKIIAQLVAAGYNCHMDGAYLQIWHPTTGAKGKGKRAYLPKDGSPVHLSGYTDADLEAIGFENLIECAPRGSTKEEAAGRPVATSNQIRFHAKPEAFAAAVKRLGVVGLWTASVRAGAKAVDLSAFEAGLADLES